MNPNDPFIGGFCIVNRKPSILGYHHAGKPSCKLIASSLSRPSHSSTSGSSSREGKHMLETRCDVYGKDQCIDEFHEFPIQTLIYRGFPSQPCLSKPEGIPGFDILQFFGTGCRLSPQTCQQGVMRERFLITEVLFGSFFLRGWKHVETKWWRFLGRSFGFVKLWLEPQNPLKHDMSNWETHGFGLFFS